MINTEIAYAKINLALHVRKRRDDGYHELETLFAFLDDGDHLSCEPADQYELICQSDFGAAIGPVEDNLVTRAARLVREGGLPSLRFHVDKRLPVAAGLGGGSADAAAALRLMDAGHRQELAAALGADVPACLNSRPVIGRGTGTELAPIENDVAGLACLLVNPKVPMPTGPVFGAWDGIDRGPMPEGSAREVLMTGRNDLEVPAISLCPVIANVLDHLGETNPLIARMSGSGATCFAIYEGLDQARVAQSLIRNDWWTMIGQLR